MSAQEEITGNSPPGTGKSPFQVRLFSRKAFKGSAVIFLSAHRERDLENGAAIPVVRADRSLMQVDDLLRQGKADAGFPAPPHVEAVKDVGKIFRGNAVPVVLYPYRHMTLVRTAGQVQLTVGIAHAVG